MTDAPLVLVGLCDVLGAVVEDCQVRDDTEDSARRAAVPGLRPTRRCERGASDLPRSWASYQARSAARLESWLSPELMAKGDTTGNQRLRPSFEAASRGVFAWAAHHGGSGGWSRGCVAVLISVDLADEDDYRSWYCDANGPLVARVPWLVRLRRYEREEDSAHLTVGEMTGPAMLDGNSDIAAKSASRAASRKARSRREQEVYIAGPPADTSEEDGT